MQTRRMIPFPDPATAIDDADRMMTDTMVACRKRLGRPIVVGLCGAQGSGKSTTAARLAGRLAAAGHRAAVMSIDDFYLPLAARRALSLDVHPLLLTRGVPGTHDIALAARTITDLLRAPEGAVVVVPTFDKTLDDREAPAQWTRQRGPFDIVLLEGWCIGARPQDEASLGEPINDLERLEDADGRWRRYVNAQLAGIYAEFFQRLDLRLMLRAPDFSHVHAWRAEQEAGLRRTPGRSLAPMDDRVLSRFISHYERITRHLLAEEPADLIVNLGADRIPVGWRMGIP